MMEQNILNKQHWVSDLYLADKLQEEGHLEDAYGILREVYEKNIFRFDKDIHGSYETYIVEKIKFFQQLAELSFKVTKEPARSIPYLDEALIMLDGAESVHPYISPKEILSLKKSYLSQIK